MQKTFACKYCGKQWETNQKRNGHQTHCKLNPKKQEIEGKIGKSLSGKYFGKIEPKLQRTISCLKCGNQFKLSLTRFQYQSGKHTKHCSRACANSRIHSKDVKDKISNSLKDNFENIAYTNCMICGKLFIRKASKPKKICSSQCLSIHRKELSKLALESGGGWRSRKIISYPEQFFMKVLTNNDIEYVHNYKVEKNILDETERGCFFLDFYLPEYNIDLEIDGSQHELQQNIVHDAYRDSLISKEYIIYRIKWNSINTKLGSVLMKTKINEFLEYLKGYSLIGKNDGL